MDRPGSFARRLLALSLFVSLAVPVAAQQRLAGGLLAAAPAGGGSRAGTTPEPYRPTALPLPVTLREGLVLVTRPLLPAPVPYPGTGSGPTAGGAEIAPADFPHGEGHLPDPVASGTVPEGYEAFVLFGGDDTENQHTRPFNIETFKALAAGYARAGFRVHGFYAPGNLAGLESRLRKVAVDYLSRRIRLRAVVLHYFGHGWTGQVRLVKPGGGSVFASHRELGQLMSRWFPPAPPEFRDIAFGGIFDACSQASALRLFPSGIASTGRVFRGIVASSSAEGAYSGVARYSRDYASGLKAASARRNPIRALLAAHEFAKPYVKIQRPPVPYVVW